jgi:hypothetical protein
MTKMLDRGIKAVKSLPPDQQDLAGELLLELASSAAPKFGLSPAQIEDLKLTIAEADGGDFATDADVEEAWKRFE